jgi:hypothetical protein
MKKFFLLICSYSIVVGAFSQNVIKEIDNLTDTRFIPGAYMKNGIAAIYFSDDEYGYDGEDENRAEIFDFELNPLKTFGFRTLQPYTIVESRTSTGTIIKTKDIEREIDTLSWFADTSDMETRKSQFAKYLYNREAILSTSIGSLDDVIANAIIDGTTIYIPMPIVDNSYYYDYSYDYYAYSEYLSSVTVYLKADNTYGYLYHYSITVPKCDGEWTTTTTPLNTKSNFYTPRCVDVSNMNHWNGGVYLPFSQTFFNDDEQFEYVSYKAEIAIGGSTGYFGYISDIEDPRTTLFGITDSDRDGDGEEDYKSTLYGIHYKGFEVVSEDGSVLYTFDIPATNRNSAIEFYKSDDHILAELIFGWQDENGNNKSTTRFYRIDKTSTSAPELIREENRVFATPNPASKGTPIVMALPSDSSKVRKVVVTSLNGGQTFSQSVAPGVSQVSIPTENLSSGMYLFTVIENGRKIDTCKIIIK